MLIGAIRSTPTKTFGPKEANTLVTWVLVARSFRTVLVALGATISLFVVLALSGFIVTLALRLSLGILTSSFLSFTFTFSFGLGFWVLRTTGSILEALLNGTEILFML